MLATLSLSVQAQKVEIDSANKNIIIDGWKIEFDSSASTSSTDSILSEPCIGGSILTDLDSIYAIHDEFRSEGLAITFTVKKKVLKKSIRFIQGGDLLSDQEKKKVEKIVSKIRFKPGYCFENGKKRILPQRWTIVGPNRN